jgi:hypothetical protein
MPLQRALVDQLAIGGLNDSIDPRVAPAGTMLTLENLVYDKAGALVRRGGFPTLNQIDSDGGDMKLVELICAAGDETICVHCESSDGGGLFCSLVDTGPVQGWRICDGISRVAVRRDPKVRAHASVTGGQTAITSAGHRVTVWLDPSDGTLFSQCEDVATGTVIAAPGPVATAFSLLFLTDSYKLVTVGGVAMLVVNVGIGAVGTPNLVGFYWGGISWTGPITLVSVSAGVGVAAVGAQFFDVADAINGTVVLAWQRGFYSGTPAVNDRHQFLRRFDTSWAPVTAAVDIGHVTGGSGAGANPAPAGITVSAGGAVTYVAWTADDGSVSWARYSSVFALQVGPILIQGTVVPFAVLNLCSSLDPSTADCWVSWFGLDPLAPTSGVNATWFAQVAFAGTIMATDKIWNSIPISSPFSMENGVYEIVATLEGVRIGSGASPFRLALWKLNDAQNGTHLQLVGDLAADGSGNAELFVKRLQTPPVRRSDGQYEWAHAVVTDTEGRAGIDTWTFNPEPLDEARFNTCEANGLLVLSGGLTSLYDGREVTELGFLGAPEVTATVAAGALTGTYTYLFTWEWWDAKGNLHFSQLSRPVIFSAAAGPPTPDGPPLAAQAPTFKIFDLGVTARGRDSQGLRQHVRLGVYRTLAGGTTFYRVNSPLATSPTDLTLPGDRSVARLTYTDSTSDASLVASGFGFLYADPITRVLDHEAPPASLDVHTHRNRIWVVSAEDDHELWFSKELRAGTGPGFNSVLTVRIDDANDGIRALGSVDAHLVAFTADKIYVIDGQGPNDTGDQNDYSVSRVASNVGCDNPRSVVAFEGGLLFQAPNGHMYLLDRSLSVQYVGQAIEALSESFPFALSVSLDDVRTRIVWVLGRRVGVTIAETTCVVFDYRMKAWSTFALSEDMGDHFDGAHGIDPQGRLLFAIANAERITREDGSFLDGDGVSFSSTLGLPWLRVGQIAGFQRVWRAMVTGASAGAGNVSFFLSYDYESEPSASYGRTYGNEDPMQIDMHLARQKCAAVQMTIVAKPTDALRGPDFVGVTWEVGVLPGREKWAQSNRAGKTG